ncbi:DUF563 domain-containing protein [Hymenobacter sp. BT730]|uniref:glycosyltransferase family 61 protein n=1 Tax=Hymenobacter sp. BT730 TaxID=3063332 RepID=UPI0026DF9A1A|nr:glycosyltransferase family 61 protein [Hymenobacter sp. BT730]
MHNIVARAGRKASRFFREIVPYQLHYRPIGVHPSSRELSARPGSQVAYYEVVPAGVSHVHVPDDFYEQASNFGGLYSKPNRTEEVPPAAVVVLKNGRIYADNPNSVAVVAADGGLVGDISFQFTKKAWDLLDPASNNIFQQRFFQEPLEVAGTVCSLLSGGGAANGNYYHWIIDSLPRLHLVREAGLLHSTDFFLVYDKTLPFVAQTTQQMGIRPEQLLDVKSHPHVRAKQLVVTTAVRGTRTHTPTWACDFLRDVLLPPPQIDRHFGAYIYISRRDAAFRHVVNEPELEAMLRPYGFETHILTPYSQAEKIALFARARVIVAPVGAGLANIVFSSPGTQLIELFPKNFVVADFLELSARLGMGYQHQVCASPQASHSRLAANADHLLVDLPTLRRQVEHAMLEHFSPASFAQAGF